MKRALFASLCVLVVAGCKKEEPTANLPPEVQQQVQKALKENVPEVPAGTPTTAGAAQKIDCEKLISPEVRSKYFAGTTLKQAPACQGCPEACTLLKGEADPAAPSVMFDCRDRDRENWFEKVSKLLGKTGKQVDGVGRLARTQMNMQLMFIPEKYNCVVTITWMDGPDQLLPLAKELEPALTAAALGI